MGYCLNIILHAYFDLLKPKSDNIPGELDKTKLATTNKGKKPQETIVDKGYLLPSIHQHPAGK